MMPADTSDNASETECRSLRDAEAALRLINAARQLRGEGELELAALDLARARTIRALDSLLRDAALWQRLGQMQGGPDDRTEAESAVTDALTEVLVRVGHVPPPRVIEIVSVARQSLNAIPPNAGITPADIVAATKVALVHLRSRLIALANADPGDVQADDPAVVNRWRAALDATGQALVHLVTAGGVPARNAPRWAIGLLSVVTTLGWSIAGNLATDAIKGEPQAPPPRQPAAAAPAVPDVANANPFSRLRDLHGQPQPFDPIRLRNLRQDLLDDIAGSDKWSAAYRLARLEQLVMDGAVSELEAKPVRAELERQQANGM